MARDFHSHPEGESLPETYRIFLEVVERGSMSKASWNLGLDVSVVSRSVAAIERRFAAVLFERHSRGVRLTEAGTLVESFVRSAIAKELDVRRELENLRELKGASLRVVCSSSALAGPVSDVVNRFAVRYHDVQIDIRRVPARSIVTLVAEGDADIGIGFNLDRGVGLDVTGIFRDVLSAVVPDEHPIARLATVSRTELSDFPVGAFEFNSAKGQMVQRFLEDGPNAVRPHLLTNSLDALKRFSESKSGVSIMCRSAMWREMSTGHMCAVPLDGVSPVRQELCARRTANDNPVVNAFMQEMKGIRPLKLSA